MKIANKELLVLSIGAAFVIAPCFTTNTGFSARAADAPVLTPPPPLPPVAPAAPAAAAPSPATLSDSDISKSVSADVTKSVSGAEDRAADNAKAVLKKLDNTDAATLEDLNAARQAIARLQAMTELEKKLADFEKARSDRTGHSSLASAIPASALAPPLPIMPNPSVFKPIDMPNPINEMPHPIMSSGVEISRIIGVDGKYAAMLKTGGDVRTYRVGDKISGSGTLVSISPTSVQIEENGSTRTLHVKNADIVYSAMR